MHHYQYEDGKWTVKDILQHMIDVERVFAYRALRFARYDFTELPGFDVDDFAKAAQIGHDIHYCNVVREKYLSIDKVDLE